MFFTIIKLFDLTKLSYRKRLLSGIQSKAFLLWELHRQQHLTLSINSTWHTEKTEYGTLVFQWARKEKNDRAFEWNPELRMSISIIPRLAHKTHNGHKKAEDHYSGRRPGSDLKVCPFLWRTIITRAQGQRSQGPTGAIRIQEIIQALRRGHSVSAGGRVRLEDSVSCSLNKVRISHTVCGLGPAVHDADVIQGAHQCGHTAWVVCV